MRQRQRRQQQHTQTNPTSTHRSRDNMPKNKSHDDVTLMTTAAAAVDEGREPGGLAPRQLPGNSDDNGMSDTTASTFGIPPAVHLGGGEGGAQDFGFGSSFGSHIPAPLSPGTVARRIMAHGESHTLHHSQGSSGGGMDGTTESGRSCGGSSSVATTNEGHPGERHSFDHGSTTTSPSETGGRGSGPPVGHPSPAAAAAAAASTTTTDVASCSSSALCEQVSLPDDIYGAARVSEYWHGVPALSSLASTYVYDDIWAGDGGLNLREDIVDIVGWTAADGYGGGGGEAEAGSSGTESHTGSGGGSLGAGATPSRRSSGGSSADDELEVGAGER
ncbi:unnamed protein product, partial [Pylaiella littoralis]